MDPLMLAALVENSLRVAVSVSQLARQHGMTQADIDALWDQQRHEWSKDWAEWLAQQARDPV